MYIFYSQLELKSILCSKKLSSQLVLFFYWLGIRDRMLKQMSSTQKVTEGDVTMIRSGGRGV